MQFGQLLFAWPIMHSIQCRHVVAFKIARRTHIRGDHAFFNQFVRIVSHNGNHRINLSIFAKHNARLGSLKIDSATFVARLE